MPRLIDDELFGRELDGRVEDPDLIEGGLRSKSFATVVDLLGYGEIEGLRKPSNTNPDTADSEFATFLPPLYLKAKVLFWSPI